MPRVLMYYEITCKARVYARLTDIFSCYSYETTLITLFLKHLLEPSVKDVESIYYRKVNHSL